MSMELRGRGEEIWRFEIDSISSSTTKLKFCTDVLVFISNSTVTFWLIVF